MSAEQASSADDPSAVASSSSTAHSAAKGEGEKAKAKTPSIDEKLATAREHKDRANKAFASGDLAEALRLYHTTLLYSSGINSVSSQYGGQTSEKQIEEAKALTNTVQLNLAACYIKQQKWEKAIAASSKVLKDSPDNTKALFRRATAYLRTNESMLAAKDVDKAMEIAPEDPSIKSLAKQIVADSEQREAKQKREWRGFLSKGAAPSSSPSSSSAAPVTPANANANANANADADAGAGAGANTGTTTSSAASEVAWSAAADAGDQKEAKDQDKATSL